MTRRTTLVVPALPVLLLTAMPLAAHAQDVSSTPPTAREHEREREARALFQLAHAHYDAGRYNEAVGELERAYELSPRVEILLDIHLAYRELGNTERSADALRRYLAGAPAIDAENRIVLERRLAALDATLAQQRQATTATTTATATAAATTATTTETAPTSETPTETTETATTATTSETTPAATTETSTPPASSADTTPWGAVAAFAIGGVGAVTTAIAGPLALSERDKLTCSPTCTDSEVSSARTLGIAADVGLGVAAAGAITGVILLLTQPSGSSSSDVAFVVAPLPDGAAVWMGGAL